MTKKHAAEEKTGAASKTATWTGVEPLDKTKPGNPAFDPRGRSGFPLSEGRADAREPGGATVDYC